jgi:tetratricopeptide (TPR) repeat protein
VKPRRWVLPALLALAWGCRSARPPTAPAYLLDPRLGLEGPFDPQIATAWEALAGGRPAPAAGTSAPGPAGQILSIQEALAAGALDSARSACEAAFHDGIQTAPLLAACGETAGRQGRWIEAHDLFEAAMLRLPASAALRSLVQHSTDPAATELVGRAEEELSNDEAAEARSAAERARSLNPGNVEATLLAGRAARSEGDLETAFERFREAMAARPKDSSIAAQTADLAFRTQNFAEASAIYGELARKDRAYAERARAAEEEFLVSNWPPAERAAAHAPRLTRAQAIGLLWRLVAPLRSVETRATPPVATDILDRGDQRRLSRALQLGLLTVELATHRARPDAFVTRAEAIRMLLRAGELAGWGKMADCMGRVTSEGAQTAAAARCGLIAEGRARSVSGPAFRAAVRAMREAEAR